MFLLLLVTACVGTADKPLPAAEDTACVASSWYADGDGDGFGDATRGTAEACAAPEGYGATDGDCDDTDGDVYPGASEVCDEVDQDCDGESDEDAIDAETWYADADEDGLGDAANTHVSCDLPDGYVPELGDCDDTDPTVSTGSVERCGGGDEDCDGETDEADAIDALTWYADTDGDGFGDLTDTTVACEAPTGFVADATDCDDTVATISPDGTEVCDGVDQDCDDEVDEGATDAPTWYADTDGDTYGDASSTTSACDAPEGYVADATDCDDTDASTSPGGTEVCGGADEDCDGDTDETDASDASTWYADADADGFGDASNPGAACSEPAGFVADDTDCDDADAGVYPGAIEVCDGLDQDCDTVADDDAIDASTWYTDADGDTFGDAAAPTAACEAPAGTVADDTDCDDTDATVIDGTTWYRDADVDGRGSPTDTVYTCTRPYGYTDDATDCDDTNASAHPAMTETCATAFDDDCDGDTEGATDCSAWYADADADSYGDPSTSACACDASTAYPEADADDCDDADDAVYPGAPEVWGDGVDQSCGGNPDTEDLEDAAILLQGVSRYDRAGTSVASADMDGDGLPDLVIGAYGSDRGSADAGAVYIEYGAPSAAASLSTADVVLEGGDVDDYAGSAVAAGDVDGDGIGDVLVGGPYSSWSEPRGGMAWLASAPVTGAPSLYDVATMYEPEATNDSLGSAVALLGDHDADGDQEIAIGAEAQSSGVGAVYLYDGGATGTLGPADATAVLRGADTSDRLGSVLANVGDLDGDGIDDLGLGVPGHTVTGGVAGGAAYVVYGPTPAGDALLADVADVILEGSRDGERAGAAVTGAGDMDGDGLADLLVSAPEPGLTTAGHVYLHVTPTTGAIEDATTRFDGAVTGALGTSIAGNIDIDGDGSLDVALTEPFESFASAAGGVHLVFAPSEPVISIDDASATLVGTSSSNTGYAVVGVQDADGDGLDDLLLGASRDDTTATDAGGAWFVGGR